jgi:hypothetical protein
VRVKSAAFPKREKERTGALKSRLCLLCERAFSSFSLDSNESEILLSRMRDNTERPREGCSCARVETYHDKFFY